MCSEPAKPVLGEFCLGGGMVYTLVLEASARNGLRVRISLGTPIFEVNMRVTEIHSISLTEVKIDEGYPSAYRRYNADNWEALYGESWEPQFDCEELERAYQNYIEVPFW